MMRASFPVAQRYRIAAERVGLATLVQRLAPLVTRGTKSVLTIGAVSPEDVDSALMGLVNSLDLQCAVVDAAGGVNELRGALCVARQRASILQGAEIQQSIAANDRSAMTAMGRLVGFPECCVDAHVQGPFAHMPLPNWAVLARRAEMDAPVPTVLQPLLVPSLAFVPCSMRCSRACALYERWFQTLGIDPNQYGGTGLVQVLSLSGPPNDDFVTLRRLEQRNGILSYDPMRVEPATSPLSATLATGTRLTPTPADLRVLSGERVVALLGPQHAIWSTDRCWNAEQWRQQALLEAARAAGQSTAVVPSG